MKYAEKEALWERLEDVRDRHKAVIRARKIVLALVEEHDFELEDHEKEAVGAVATLLDRLQQIRAGEVVRTECVTPRRPTGMETLAGLLSYGPDGEE